MVDLLCTGIPSENYDDDAGGCHERGLTSRGTYIGKSIH